MEGKSLFFTFYKTLLKSRMQYKLNFILEIFVNLITYITTYLSLYILFSNFSVLSRWNYYEIIVLYSVNLFTYGMASLFFFIPMTQLENMVVSGELDFVLIRPIHPIRYLVMRQNYVGFLSHILVSTGFFCYGISNLTLSLNFVSIIIFSLNILGGILIQSSIFILFGALSFKFNRIGNLTSLIIYKIRSLTDYPLSIYPMYIQTLLLFFPPYAFVSFIPVSIFLNKQSQYQMFGLLPFIVGLLSIILTVILFEKMISRYTSTGN